MERKPTNTSGLIANAANKPATAPKAAQTVNSIINGLMDSDGYRKRFGELLGDRAPQFISSVISLVNADQNLVDAAKSAPQTIIQSALKAAIYDLPVDNTLGFAYIVPFKNMKKGGIHEAQFILGYKGMIQLALRTGCYQRINVMDVREGELIKADRLREDYDFNWIEDEEEREKANIVGYVGYFRLINGTEKLIYMSSKQIEAHERKNRKGNYMGKGWRDDYDSMARKTVLRRLLGKWGVMSIDYKAATPGALRAAENIAGGMLDDDTPGVPEGTIDITGTGSSRSVPDAAIDPETGEVTIS